MTLVNEFVVSLADSPDSDRQFAQPNFSGSANFNCSLKAGSEYYNVEGPLETSRISVVVVRNPTGHTMATTAVGFYNAMAGCTAVAAWLEPRILRMQAVPCSRRLLRRDGEPVCLENRRRELFRG
jgi:hypothetical protein